MKLATPANIKVKTARLLHLLRFSGTLYSWIGVITSALLRLAQHTVVAQTLRVQSTIILVSRQY